jgi:TrmH family RNA methyltransferase
MSLQLTSSQNKRIKNIVKLRQRRQRDRQQLTVIEGVREASLALQHQVIPLDAYVCPFLFDREASAALWESLQDLKRRGLTQLFEVPPDLFAKIAYRGETGGLILLAPYRQLSLADLPLGEFPFLAVIEDVEKPGNLGAILRSADAAGVDGVIISRHQAEGGTDIHNPNVIRSSLGTLFAVPVVEANTAELIPWLKQQGIRIVAATPLATATYTAVDLTGPVALVLGSEAHGLSGSWLAAADDQVAIPMRGVADSLNLSVSTALLLYEVVRQRDRGRTKELVAETAAAGNG